MEIETLKAMNESLSQSMLMMLEVTVLIIVICVSAGFVIYLAGIAWLCFEEMRQPSPRRMKPARPTKGQLSAHALLEKGKPCEKVWLPGQELSRAVASTDTLPGGIREKSAANPVIREVYGTRVQIKLSLSELDDAIEVLNGGHLHPEAQKKLRQAAAIDAAALITSNTNLRNQLINQAIALKNSARADIAY